MFACCVLQSRVCALDTNLIFATATEVNFIPDIPMSNLGAFFAKKKKNRFIRTAYLSRNSGFPRLSITTGSGERVPVDVALRKGNACTGSASARGR